MNAPDASSGGETTRLLREIERFASKCEFDACTGCVNWAGGTGSSRGGRERVGRFWQGGKMWNAHQWAAKYIHGLPIEGHTIRRTCRNPLCVQHLEASEGPQTADQRFHWLAVGKGFREPEPLPEADPDAFPFALEPDWLRAFKPRQETTDDPF